MIFASEHKPLSDLPDHIKIEGDIKNAHMLGLHRQRDGQFAPGNFIGAVWLEDGKTILCVSPKFDWMDYLAMFLECAKHPQVRAHLRPCFNVWPKESLIDMPPQHDFSLLIIIAFLRELNDFYTAIYAVILGGRRRISSAKSKAKFCPLITCATISPVHAPTAYFAPINQSQMIF